MAKIPELTPVKSSNVDAIGHDGQKLFVRFKGKGTVYSYTGVTQAMHDEMKAHESPGGYFHSKIKGNFDFEKHDPE